MLFGQAGELFMGDGPDASSAEERIKSLLGDASSGLARRRIVRRPYQPQPHLFSEREKEGGSPGMVGDPLSDLIAHLASRKSGADARAREPDRGSAASGAAGGASLSGLAQLVEDAHAQRAASGSGEEPQPQLRSCFVSQLLLSAIANPELLHDPQPLDVAPARAAPRAEPEP
jgi:hypothetical protein